MALCLCSSSRNIQGKVGGPLKGVVSAEKALQESQTERRELLKGTKEVFFKKIVRLD